MRGYLEIFYCSFSVPSASSRKGGEVEYFKGCELGTGEKLGLCACVIHVLLVFFHSWTHSIWDLDLTQVEKPKHTDLKVMGLFSLQVPVNSLLGHWIWSNSFLPSCFESPVLGCRRGDVLPSLLQEVWMLSPLQGSACSRRSWAVISSEKMCM